MADSASRKHGVVLTYEDYLSLPDDLNRYEILEGELVATPAPSPLHQRVSRNLEFLLFRRLRETEGAFSPKGEYSGNRTFEPELFQGLAIDLAEVWE